MDAAGIVFGSFDLIKTVDGQYCFVEVNEGGQFLGYELDDVPLLQTFADFLISGDQKFTATSSDIQVPLAQFYESAEGKAALDMANTDEVLKHFSRAINE